MSLITLGSSKNTDGQSSRVIILLIITALLCILTFPKHLYPCDPYWVRMQAQAWLEGQGDVPAPYALSQPAERGQFFFCNPRNGKYYLKYGVFTTIFTMPPIYIWNKISGHTIYDMADWYGSFIKQRPYAALGYHVTDYDRRLLTLSNWYNLLWVLLLAFVLYKGSLQFCKRQNVGLVWTLISLFGGFGWNYLRAHTGEIFQWTMSALFFSCSVALIRSLEKDRSAPSWMWASAWIGLLCLIMLKCVYVLIVPVWLAIIIWSYCRINELKPSTWPQRSLQCFFGTVWLWLPLFFTAALFLGTNYWRFGDCFSTGYTQWAPVVHPFSGNLWGGLCGFLLQSDKSIFLHQPLLLFSLVAMPIFCKRFPKEACLIGVNFLISLLLNSAFVDWEGTGCYGPRYLLFIMCELTWPSLLLFDYLLDNWQKIGSKVAMLFITVAVGVSFYFQTQVNSLDFFTYYEFAGFMDYLKVSDNVKSQYYNKYWGFLCRDLNMLRMYGIRPKWLILLDEEDPKGGQTFRYDYMLSQLRDN